MKAFKILLTVLATIVGAVGGCMSAGLITGVPLPISEFVLSGAGLLAGFGYVPLMVSAAVARVLYGVSAFMAAGVALHASLTAGHPSGVHAWIWSVVAGAAIVVGYLGKSPIQHAGSAVPAAPPKA